MFVIQSGAVVVSKRTPTGERPIATLRKGEFVGEMAILNNKPRSASATALEDGACVVIDAKTLEVMISKNAEIALRLIKKLAARLDATDAFVQILLQPDPHARVLLGLKRRAEAAPTGEPLHIESAEFASEVGSPPEVVGDVLRRLARAGIELEDNGHDGFVIADCPGLIDLLASLDEAQAKELS